MQTNKQTNKKDKENVFLEKLLFYGLDAIQLVGKCFQACGLHEGFSLSGFTGPITIIKIIDFVSV